MDRHIRGLLTATVAAPYLVVFILTSIELLFGVATFKDVLEHRLLIDVSIGTVALLLFGIPILVVLGLWALLMNAFGWRSRRAFVLSGTILGLCLTLAVLSSFSHQTAGNFFAWLTADLELFMSLNGSGGAAGALCGWIYWRILKIGVSEA